VLSRSVFLMFGCGALLQLLAVLLLELALCHFSEIEGIFVLEGELGIRLDGFIVGDRLHADDVELLRLLAVDVFVLQPQHA
jgi:hypothetical protein